MDKLDPQSAKKIIEPLAANGIPPEFGLEYFTVGIDHYLEIIDKEYLSTYIKEGGSSFKMVIGTYGGGKTHFLYSIRNIAWKNKYLVSYISLSPNETPFYKLDSVYGSIAKNLTPPLSTDELIKGYKKGIHTFLQSWYAAKFKEIKYAGQNLSNSEAKEQLLEIVKALKYVENLSYFNALKAAIFTLADNNMDEFISIIQWLNGEGYTSSLKKYGISEKLNKTNAFSFIRSLSQFIGLIGYSGFLILFDEAERIPSLSSKNKELLLNNLRELIDECAKTSFRNTMIFYAVPDENFLEGRSAIYEALKQRVATILTTFNPSGVKIYLENIENDPVRLLSELGEKLVRIFKVAYDFDYNNQTNLLTFIQELAQKTYEMRFGDIGYKRLFVQKLIQSLKYLKSTLNLPTFKELGFE